MFEIIEIVAHAPSGPNSADLYTSKIVAQSSSPFDAVRVAKSLNARIDHLGDRIYSVREAASAA